MPENVGKWIDENFIKDNGGVVKVEDIGPLNSQPAYREKFLRHVEDSELPIVSYKKRP